MAYELDEIDRRIVYALMEDARNTSATDIASGLDVSPGTVRNRIDRLEDEGVIQGYTAQINFERAGGRLVGIYMCTIPAAKRERLAMAAQSIPGVINVRVLMAGRRDLHVIAVGETTEDLRNIARRLSDLDIQIEDEELLQTELQSPYEPFGSDDYPKLPDGLDVVSLADGTDVVDVEVDAKAPVVGRTITEAQERDIISSDLVVLVVERRGEIIPAVSETTLQAGDVVTLIPGDQSREAALAPFTAPAPQQG